MCARPDTWQFESGVAQVALDSTTSEWVAKSRYEVDNDASTGIRAILIKTRYQSAFSRRQCDLYGNSAAAK